MEKKLTKEEKEIKKKLNSMCFDSYINFCINNDEELSKEIVEETNRAFAENDSNE